LITNKASCWPTTLDALGNEDDREMRA